MSRTRHHRHQRRQHRDHDLWKPGPTCGAGYSAETKRRGRRIQRKWHKRDLNKELKTLPQDDNQ